jgi:general secretion pathway protein F
MIKAGESSGNLDIVLLRLTEFLDGQLGLQQKLVAAAVYPLLMVVLGTFIVAYLMASVVPKVTQIFDDQEAALPFITQVLIFASDVVAGYWWLILLVLGAAIYGFRRWKVTPAGHYKWDRFVLRMPVFGDLVRMIAVSRFAKTMSTLLASGVPLLGALDIVKNILGNVILIDVIEKARLNIREGESIAGPLKRSGEFPPMVTHMIAVGERTGELESMLESVADAYDQQVSSRVAALTSLLEPLMIVVMGGAVGFIVFAILLPILKMNEAFAQ